MSTFWSPFSPAQWSIVLCLVSWPLYLDLCHILVNWNHVYRGLLSADVSTDILVDCLLTYRWLYRSLVSRVTTDLWLVVSTASKVYLSFMSQFLSYV